MNNPLEEFYSNAQAQYDAFNNQAQNQKAFDISMIAGMQNQYPYPYGGFSPRSQQLINLTIDEKFERWFKEEDEIRDRLYTEPKAEKKLSWWQRLIDWIHFNFFI